jgi:plasmid maintenance system antidote protein VapI
MKDATKPLPAHGTYARAKGRRSAGIKPCRCTPCQNAVYRYDKQRLVDKAAGRERTIPAGPTARIVESLAAAGMTLGDIAAAAPCSTASIHNLRQPGARVTVGLAKRIAAVRARASATKQVPAFGATRRIRAAMAVGHTQNGFAAETGLSEHFIGELVNGRVSSIIAENHDLIDEAYQKLRRLPAPVGKWATRTRRRAAAAGWPTPEQWDDRIDDPDADPASWVRTDERRTSEEIAAEADEIKRTWDVSWDLIAERLGVKRNTLEKARERVAARAKAGAL